VRDWHCAGACIEKRAAHAAHVTHKWTAKRERWDDCCAKPGRRMHQHRGLASCPPVKQPTCARMPISGLLF
jgi:hypothetical protein